MTAVPDEPDPGPEPLHEWTAAGFDVGQLPSPDLALHEWHDFGAGKTRTNRNRSKRGAL